MIRADKILLRPDAPQIEHFKKSTGVGRYAFNWCLRTADEYYKITGYTLPDSALSAAWNACRRISKPWTYEVSKFAGESGVLNFIDARHRWFEDLKEYRKDPTHKIQFKKPKIKTLRRSKRSFTIRHASSNVRVDEDRLKLPMFDGTVRMSRRIRFPGKIKAVTISEQGGRWFASFQIEISEDYVYPHRCENQATSSD